MNKENVHMFLKPEETEIDNFIQSVREVMVKNLKMKTTH
jgi:hypothetical protein